MSWRVECSMWNNSARFGSHLFHMERTRCTPHIKSHSIWYALLETLDHEVDGGVPRGTPHTRLLTPTSAWDLVCCEAISWNGCIQARCSTWNNASNDCENSDDVENSSIIKSMWQCPDLSLRLQEGTAAESAALEWVRASPRCGSSQSRGGRERLPRG